MWSRLRSPSGPAAAQPQPETRTQTRSRLPRGGKAAPTVEATRQVCGGSPTPRDPQGDVEFGKKKPISLVAHKLEGGLRDYYTKSFSNQLGGQH